MLFCCGRLNYISLTSRDMGERVMLTDSLN
jgi:hypothetical protein